MMIIFTSLCDCCVDRGRIYFKSSKKNTLTPLKTILQLVPLFIVLTHLSCLYSPHISRPAIFGQSSWLILTEGIFRRVFNFAWAPK
jgi:hypothetical protein